MTGLGRERPIHHPMTMSGYIALRRTGLGHLRTFGSQKDRHLNACLPPSLPTFARHPQAHCAELDLSDGFSNQLSL